MTEPITVFICGGPKTANCTGIGCNAHSTATCSFPLRGHKLGQTCSKALCPEHTVYAASGPLCRAHGPK